MLLERLTAFRLRCRALLHRRRLERDLDEELAFHHAMRAEQCGEDPAARAAARRQFGNATRIRETCRDLWTFPTGEGLWQDLRYAVRTLANTPTFTLVAVLSLALGIGANIALFSLMDVMLLRTLPVENPQQLVEFARAGADATMTNLPYQVFEFLGRDHDALSDLFAIRSANPAFQTSGPPRLTRAHEVSGSYFPALGVRPLLGRTISPDDDRTAAANRVAVLSHAFWSVQFGQDPSALGAAVRLSGERYTIIGIMPPEFFGVDRAAVPDLWVPLSVNPDPGEVWILGRLRPGLSAASAQARLDPLFRQALQSQSAGFQHASQHDRDAFLAQRLLVNPAAAGTSTVRWTYWDYSATLKILLGLTGLVLLIACANLANLLIARSAARSRELGIRLALGAGRWRLVRQLMTENLLLALFGGALGLLVAGWAHPLMVGFLTRDPLRVALDFRLDYRLLAFGVALSVATGLLFGLLPSLRATRAGISGSIRHAGRPGSPAHRPWARILLAVQIGLSMILLVGAGLFARSLRNLGSADLGLRRDNLLLLSVQPAAAESEARRQFYQELIRRVSALAGVQSVALAGDAVFGNGGWNQTVWIESQSPPAKDAKVSMNLTGPGFFATTGIPLLAGREFGEGDHETAPRTALVNQTFARRFFGTRNPIGQHFGDLGPSSTGRYEIVGIVGDAKYGSIREKLRPMVFYPLWQSPPRASLEVHVRTRTDPAALIPALRREVQAIDGEALLGEIRNLPGVVRAQLRQDRMIAALAGFFALLALALSAIGIYGVLAYRVARQSAEIGVRLALGAQRSDVLWLIMKETLFLLAAGAAIGVPSALAAARLLRSLLFGLAPSDPLTLACAVTVLFAAGALAGIFPALRAMSVEPTVALRAE
ncbi:ADOP family duplicated permease [Paludibaculum fermentans]|uniref:ABC transporter permease n=1 Tax=Paludibaculum fermentans TaxID=1473598 RepID=UPI003EC0DE45